MNAPDPHGQAALMLCEALIHLLLEQGKLSRDDVCDAIDGLVEIKEELSEQEEPAAISRAARGLLLSVRLSLQAK